MRPYQLAALAAAFFSDVVECAPAATPAAQHGYVSKYPQHPSNLGYGDNYPKYWEGGAYNPANFPPLHPQPRIPFYPYPYSNAWQSTNTPTAPEDVEVKVVERPAYAPPHGFPPTKAPAKEAIRAYSDYAQRVSESAKEAEAAEDQPPAPKAKAASTPSLVKEHDRGKSCKNLKFTGEGGDGDGTGYTKVVNNPRKTGKQEGGRDGQSDWDKFTYKVASDALVHHDPHGAPGALAVPGRRTNAMGSIHKLLEGYEGSNWNKDLQKREEWPEHIQLKAEKMMKSAAAMQERGQGLMEKDGPKGKQASANNAPPADNSLPASKALPAPPAPTAPPAPPVPQKKAVPGSGAKSSVKNAADAAPASPPKKKKKEDADPLMRKELPQSTGNTKKPKQPKQSRKLAPAPTKQKPARGGKAQKPQSNSPQQRKGKKPKGGSLEKRGAAPEAAPEPIAAADPVPIKNARSGGKTPSSKGGKSAPSAQEKHGKGSSGGGKGGKAAKGGKSGGGKLRPNINQDRPSRKADRGKRGADGVEEEKERGGVV